MKQQWIRAAVCVAVGGTLGGVAWAQEPVKQSTGAHQVVVKDKATGRVRAPEHDEVLAPSATARSAAAAQTAGPLAAHPVVQQHMQARPIAGAALGAVAMRAPASRLSYLMASRGADGKVDTTCLTGDDAGQRAREAFARKGGGHAH